MIPATNERVPQNTSEAVNRQIHRALEERVARYRHASPRAIDRRLRELDEEWDIERTLEANAGTACLMGVLLGATVDRRWFYLPGVIGGFLLLHAVQGWCPPLPVLRRLGVRTEREIEVERTALKRLRGDYSTTPDPGRMPTSDLIQSIEQS